MAESQDTRRPQGPRACLGTPGGGIESSPAVVCSCHGVVVPLGPPKSVPVSSSSDHHHPLSDIGSLDLQLSWNWEYALSIPPRSCRGCRGQGGGRGTYASVRHGISGEVGEGGPPGSPPALRPSGLGTFSARTATGQRQREPRTRGRAGKTGTEGASLAPAKAAGWRTEAGVPADRLNHLG